jgi:N-acetylglucosaminyldiphosphoundecaprenol N-acetyl-beta-D-mannosaminyltransferase
VETRRQVKRIKVANVGVDIVPEDVLEELVKGMIEDGGRHQIVLLSLKGLLKTRRNSELGRAVKEATLVVPVSRGIVRGAKFLGRELPQRYMPFEFVIKLLGIIEKLKRSVYLLGGRPNDLQVAASNLRASFPGLSIVGRCAGYYAKPMEKNIVLAIKKSSPSLVLAGSGLPGRARDSWVANNKRNFHPGIYLWCGECFDIFSGRRTKPSKKSWERGTDSLGDMIRKPWRVFRGLLYLYYGLLLVVHRMRRM